MIRDYFSDLVDQVARATGWPHAACAAALAALGFGGGWFGWVYLSFGNLLVRKVGPFLQQIVWLVQGR